MPTEYDFDITLTTKNKTIIEELNKMYEKQKDVKIEIKRNSKKRSLDSNAYAWHLMEEIAKVINSDKDMVYLQMLEKYGVFTHVVVKEYAVPKMKEMWKLVKELGEVTINGNKGIQLQCYFGSSTFSQEEMCRFIKGITNECLDLNIPTLDNSELESMIKEWGI